MAGPETALVCWRTARRHSAVCEVPSCAQQGVDWRDPRAAACNGARNPIQQNFYDGINADPLEVLFIKVKGSMRRAGWDHVTQVRLSFSLSALRL